MNSVLAEAVDAIESVRHTAPVPNDVPWEIIFFCIIACSALISWGFDSMVRGWYEKRWIRVKWVMISQVMSSFMGAVVGGFAGYLVWHWGLGLAAGIVGGFCSTHIAELLRKIAAKRFGVSVTDEDKEENG